MTTTDQTTTREATGPRGLTRVTLVGTNRRVELALSSTEPAGALLPEVLRQTGQQPGVPLRSYQLSLPDGAVLDPETGLAEQGIGDGTLLRATQSPRPRPPRSSTT